MVGLVWTGPETLGAAKRDTGIVVRELFGSAESKVLVAGFAVYQGRGVFKRLTDRVQERPGLRVRLFLDVQHPPADTSLPEDLLRRFARRFREQEWPGEKLPELYYDPRSLELDGVKRSSLHAKCIVVDSRVAFATMNAAGLTGDALQALMRHKSYLTTQCYINMARQMDEAVAVLHVPEVLRQGVGG